MGIKETPEWRQSEIMRPACNRVLQVVFGVTSEAIVRFEKEGGVHILDQEFAIDLKVVLPNGFQITGQEKACSHECWKYRTFTVEFFQDRRYQIPGELFKVASQFYLHGYSDDTGGEFAEWHILKVFDLKNWLGQRGIQGFPIKPSRGSYASFLAIPYDDIPVSVYYAHGDQRNTTIPGRLSDLIPILRKPFIKSVKDRLGKQLLLEL